MHPYRKTPSWARINNFSEPAVGKSLPPAALWCMNFYVFSDHREWLESVDVRPLVSSFDVKGLVASPSLFLCSHSLNVCFRGFRSMFVYENLSHSGRPRYHRFYRVLAQATVTSSLSSIPSEGEGVVGNADGAERARICGLMNAEARKFLDGINEGNPNPGWLPDLSLGCDSPVAS